MPVVATRANAGAGGYGWSSAIAESLDGMVLITPTSVDKAGTSSTATIGANGSVEFSACTSLSLNGVFTSDYDNYLIVVFSKASAADLLFRYRAASSDNSTSSGYTNYLLVASSTTITSTRTISNQGKMSSIDGTTAGGLVAYVYAPFIAQKTVMRTATMNGTGSAQISDEAIIHSEAVAYDGISIYPNTSTVTGTISVYGLEN